MSVKTGEDHIDQCINDTKLQLVEQGLSIFGVCNILGKIKEGRRGLSGRWGKGVTCAIERAW